MIWNRNSSVLALRLAEDHLWAVLVGGTGATRCLTAPLAVDPLADDPQVVAQELRERLQPLGRLPGRALVCLALNRVLVTVVSIPEMPEAAIPGFLTLQAEREFLLPPDQLALGSSRYDLGEGQRGAVLAALPAGQYANLLRALRLAHCSRAAVTLTAVTHLAAADLTAPGAFLLANSGAVDLGVVGGGGLVRLRQLVGSSRGSGTAPDLGSLPGEVRVTLGQLPAAFGRQLPVIQVRGPAPLAAEVIAELEATPQTGLWRFAPAVPAPGGHDDEGVRAELEAAARRLAAGQAPVILLAPVAVAQRAAVLGSWTWPQLGRAAAALLLVVLVVAASLGYQQWRLSQLRSEWAKMAPRTEAVRAIIEDARIHQSWLGTQPESLQILRATTLAFPEQGAVWVTRLELRDRRQVTLAGKATSREAWLRMLEALRQTAGVRELRVLQAQEPTDGKTPLTFALSFTWVTPAPGTAAVQGGRP